MNSINVSDQCIHIAGWRESLGQFQLLLQSQAAQHQLSGLPGARQRTGEDDVKGDFHLPQRVRQELGALNPLEGQRPLVLFVARIAVLGRIAVPEDVQFHAGVSAHLYLKAAFSPQRNRVICDFGATIR